MSQNSERELTANIEKFSQGDKSVTLPRLIDQVVDFFGVPQQDALEWIKIVTGQSEQ